MNKKGCLKEIKKEQYGCSLRRMNKKEDDNVAEISHNSKCNLIETKTKKTHKDVKTKSGVKSCKIKINNKRGLNIYFATS